MKNYSLYFLVFLGVAISCGESKKGDDLLPDNPQAADSVSVAVNDSVKVITNLICLFDKSSLYSEPVKPNKWLKAINFGRELTYLKDTTIATKQYYKVATTEGDQGWISGYNVADDASVKVVISKASVYNAADPLTLSDKTIELGELVVVSNQPIGGFWKFTTAQKKITGFFKTDAVISGDINALEAAQKIKLILALKEIDEKNAALDEFIANPNYGAFTAEAQKIKTQLYEASKLEEENIIQKVKEAAELK